MSKPIIVAVSGGFDPIHIGHVRYFEAAKALGDRLVVILNNNNWLKVKKGFAFMQEEERKEIVKALRAVDDVVLTKHVEGTTDMSVCEALRELRPTIFCNGGDRVHDNIPEVAVCNKLGIQMVFNVGAGGKVNSSSWLLQKYFENNKKPGP